MPTQKRETLAPLPDLARNGAKVPGGVVAEVVLDEPVVVVDTSWSPEDAVGSPIGYTLAVETVCAPDNVVPLKASNS